MKLQLLKLNDIYKLKVAITMYNINNKIWNIDSQTQPITSINLIHKHQTRLVKKNNYHLLSIRTNLGKSVITFAETKTKIWSEIPKHIKIFQKHQFEKECKKLLLNSYNQFFFSCVFIYFSSVYYCFLDAIIAALVLLCLYFIFIYIFNV